MDGRASLGARTVLCIDLMRRGCGGEARCGAGIVLYFAVYKYYGCASVRQCGGPSPGVGGVCAPCADRGRKGKEGDKLRRGGK